jgi:hypothetical protein
MPALLRRNWNSGALASVYMSYASYRQGHASSDARLFLRVEISFLQKLEETKIGHG